MTSKNILDNITIDFSVKLIRLYLHLLTKMQHQEIIKHLLRSGTNIGVLVREFRLMQNQQTKKEKLTQALLEAARTEYWLELLFEAKYITAGQLEELIKITEQISGYIENAMTEL